MDCNGLRIFSKASLYGTYTNSHSKVNFKNNACKNYIRENIKFNLRYGPCPKWTCMKFEARHQIFKRYARNCGFKNPGFSILKKFQIMKALKPETESINSAKKFTINRTLYECCPKTVIAYQINSSVGLGILVSHSDSDIQINPINAFFDYNLLFYRILNISNECVIISKQNLLPYVGHVYSYGVLNEGVNIVQFKIFIE